MTNTIVEFSAALCSIFTPKNTKFLEKFKQEHGQEYRPVTLQLYLTTFRHNFDEVYAYSGHEVDYYLEKEFQSWLCEMTAKELDAPITPSVEQRRDVLLPTSKGYATCNVHSDCVDLTLLTHCQLNNEGYPILPTMSAKKLGHDSLFRAQGGKGRIIHPLKDIVVTRISCY